MNTILIVCDTWKRDHCGAYGNEWIRTPNIDKFAQKSAVFENAYIGSYPTLPCRNDIITGRYEFPWRGWGGLEQETVTLSGAFSDAGKISYLVTDLHNYWGKDSGNYWKDFSGFDLVRGQVLDRYITDSDVEFENRALHYPEINPKGKKGQIHFRNIQYIRRNEEDWFCAQVLRSASRWIQHNADHEDFFLMVDAFDPHEPWDPPRYYINMYDDPDYSGKELTSGMYGEIGSKLTPAEVKHIQALYAGEVTLFDRWFGYFMDQLEVMGVLDNTMVILTTDHGTYNGDHGRLGKNHVLWDPLSNIPLIIRHPKYAHGTRPKQFAQHIDFFPTALEAAGLDAPEGLHGTSLLPYLENPDREDTRDAIIFGEFRHGVYITDKEYWLEQGIDSSNPPLYSYTKILPRFCKGTWGAYDGTRRLVSHENSDNAGEERGETHFYHLPSDPDQEKDLKDSHPEELKKMQIKLIEN